MSNPKNIVVICGGSGGYQVLTGLRQYHDVIPHAVVTMADDGGSTGLLRSTMGALPPGDVRRALVALSESEEIWRQLFAYRFDEKTASNHNLGNLIIAGLEKITGNFEGAIKVASDLLQVRGTVNPVTLSDVALCVTYANGKEVCGESAVDKAIHETDSPIVGAHLKPAGILNPKARNAILKADLVVIGPGDLYTSLVPALLVKGVRHALSETSAKKVYISNLMTKRGETDGYDVQKFVDVIARYIGSENINCVIYNTKKPSVEALEKYKLEEKAEFVRFDPQSATRGISYRGEDVLEEVGIVRHDSTMLAYLLNSIVRE